MNNNFSDLENSPPELTELAKNASSDLLPKKSIVIYEPQDDLFTNWHKINSVIKYSGNILLAYFLFFKN